MSKKNKPSGQLLPFIFDNIPVRGMLLRVEDIASHVPSLAGDKIPMVLKKCLGELLAASATLANDLKYKANITLQIHSSGVVPLMVGQCSAKGNLRAYAKLDCANLDYTSLGCVDIADADENLNSLKFKDIVAEKGVFALTVEQKNSESQADSHTYQSLVELNTHSISSSIENYFNNSVQLQTYFKVFTGEIDGKFSCGALFLQVLPNSGLDSDDWRRLGILLSTLKAEEVLPGEIGKKDLLIRLFGEKDTVRVFTPHDLQFQKIDSRRGMEKALKSIGKESCLELLQERNIVMTCEFSGNEESFDKQDIDKLFDADKPHNK